MCIALFTLSCFPSLPYHTQTSQSILRITSLLAVMLGRVYYVVLGLCGGIFLQFCTGKNVGGSCPQ